MFPEIYEAIKLVANADIQRRHACDRSWRGIEDGGVYIFIEGIVAVANLVQIYDMETVASACPAFYAINLYRVIGVDMNV